jgi:antitoxin component of MazEF toxin-antitoxin module
MKRSWLISFLGLVGLALSVAALGVEAVAVKAQTPARPPLTPTVPARPVAEWPDRVLITPQAATLPRGKPGKEPGYRKTAKVRYPLISGLKDPAVLAKVQTAVSLKTMMGRSLAELRAELQENYWLTDIDYQVNYNQNFLLDLTYTIEGIGAYLSHYEKQVTVDLKTGQKLRSHDVFKRESLGTIAAQVDQVMQAEIAQKIVDLEKAGADDVDIRPHLGPAKFRVKQVDDFELNDKGVTFRYDFDFPHVMKAAEPVGRYFFTYAQLKSYIRPDGPLAPFVK